MAQARGGLYPTVGQIKMGPILRQVKYDFDSCRFHLKLNSESEGDNHERALLKIRQNTDRRIPEFHHKGLHT